MKTQTALLPFVIVLALLGCSQNESLGPEDENPIEHLSQSYMPMQIGNYWRINDMNYIEIKDTIRIEGELYYEFYALTGGDMTSKRYFRINNKNELIQRNPKNPNWIYIHAKFNADVGDTFYTLNNGTINDYKVEVIEKSDNIMKFELEMKYHPVLAGSKHVDVYEKGIGFGGGWNEIKIGEHIYTN